MVAAEGRAERQSDIILTVPVDAVVGAGNLSGSHVINSNAGVMKRTQRMLGSMLLAAWLLGCGDDGIPNPPFGDPLPDGGDSKDAGEGVVPSGPQGDLKASEGVVDACPGTYTGLTWDCQNRFVYGINYAWRRFGGDFGGVTAWETPGVAANREVYVENLDNLTPFAEAHPCEARYFRAGR